MPTAQMDFHLSIDRTGALCAETLLSARAARRPGLPPPHHRILSRAIRRLEAAQDDLYTVRQDPWSTPAQPKPRQLELLMTPGAGDSG